jgi:hypothetical protein
MGLASIPARRAQRFDRQLDTSPEKGHVDAGFFNKYSQENIWDSPLFFAHVQLDNQRVTHVRFTLTDPGYRGGAQCQPYHLAAAHRTRVIF